MLRTWRQIARPITRTSPGDLNEHTPRAAQAVLTTQFAVDALHLHGGSLAYPVKVGRSGAP